MYIKETPKEINKNRKKILEEIANAEIKSIERQYFPGQVYKTTCGVSNERIIFYNQFNLFFTTEEKLIELHTYLREKEVKKKYRLSNGQSKIINSGSAQHDLELMAKFLELRLFSSYQTGINDIKYLLDINIWPIIYRPFIKKDQEGHFVLVHKHYPESRSFKLFDPAYQHKRRRDKIIHDGKNRVETYETFNRKWKFKGLLEKGMLFFCRHNDRPDRKINGYYAV